MLLSIIVIALYAVKVQTQWVAVQAPTASVGLLAVKQFTELVGLVTV